MLDAFYRQEAAWVRHEPDGTVRVGLVADPGLSLIHI